MLDGLLAPLLMLCHRDLDASVGHAALNTLRDHSLIRQRAVACVKLPVLHRLADHRDALWTVAVDDHAIVGCCGEPSVLAVQALSESEAWAWAGDKRSPHRRPVPHRAWGEVAHLSQVPMPWPLCSASAGCPSAPVPS